MYVHVYPVICEIFSVEIFLGEDDSPATRFFGLFETVLSPDAFETFLRGSLFDKTAFCLGEKQGMLTNDEFLVH